MRAVSTPTDEPRAWAGSLARPRVDSLPLVAVTCVTLLELSLRVAGINESLLGDELSTYWILQGRSLGHVLSIVRTNAEITPPLFFIFMGSAYGATADLRAQQSTLSRLVLRKAEPEFRMISTTILPGIAPIAVVELYHHRGKRQ